MSGPDAGELEALRESVRGVLRRSWPSSADSARHDHARLWAVAAQQGWTDLAGDDLLEAVFVVQAELGRVNCPLPVVDAVVVAAVQPAGPGACDTGLIKQIAAGEVRPVVAFADRGGRPGAVAPDQDRPVVRHVEMAAAATHLLVIDLVANRAAWYSLTGAEICALPGLPVPAWSQVRPAAVAEWTCDLDPGSPALLHYRLGLAIRALSAVRRTHELAVAHAIDRRQFGQRIGGFQAVANRLAGTEMELTAAGHLLDHALRIRTGPAASWRMAAEIYLEHASSVAARLQFDAHHTLAAIGYFEEHEAPWLLRRVHADLARLQYLSIGPTVGELLVDAGQPLPAFDLGPAAETLRAEVLEAFAPWRNAQPSQLGSWDDGARDVLRQRNWIGVGWPVDAGGQGLSIRERLAFSEALAYADPPLGNIMMGINSVAPVIISAGTPEQRDYFLPRLQRGDVTVALGYSEPEAGSDLASLRTRADRVDGGWLINGQKSWATCLPDSQYILLAARTNPEARPQAGISLFLVDADSPGITVNNHVSLAGEVSSTTFWDDVRVPGDRLIGEPDQGWRALGAALAGERVLIGASVSRVHAGLERLVSLVAEPADDTGAGPPTTARSARVRSEVGRLAVRLQGARALVVAGVEATAAGGGQLLEAPMAKVMATELAEDFNATAVALIGPDALYSHSSGVAAGNGYVELALRTSIMGVVSGGTNDIQRNLIARGMGLPRSGT